MKKIWLLRQSQQPNKHIVKIATMHGPNLLHSTMSWPTISSYKKLFWQWITGNITIQNTKKKVVINYGKFFYIYNLIVRVCLDWGKRKGGVKENKVELTENKLILGYFYSILLYSTLLLLPSPQSKRTFRERERKMIWILEVFIKNTKERQLSYKIFDNLER